MRLCLCSLCAALLLACLVGCVHCSPHYSEPEAVIFAEYARVSFCEKSAVESWTCGEMCNATQTVPSKVIFIGPGKRWQVQGFVAQLADKTCVLSFRGSVDAMNWVADANAINKPWPPLERNAWCPDCRVHSGFAAAYEELRPQMLAALEELHCNSTAIVGHSLGAALANLAAGELRASGKGQVHPVYTFGSPRVGNKEFVKAFTTQAAKAGYNPAQWRVVHNDDPVPRISPTVHGFGYLDYEHTPEEVYYNEDSSAYRVCDSLPSGEQNPECSAATPIWKWVNFDHLTYLNQSFAHRKMPSECTGSDLHMVQAATTSETLVVV